MTTRETQETGDAQRLVGQQLGSVLVAIDYISLKFAKYPLKENGEFSDVAAIDVEEGFEIASANETHAIRKGADLPSFRLAAARLLPLIDTHVTQAQVLADGTLALHLGGVRLHFPVNEEGFDAYQLSFSSPHGGLV